jgi:molybdopterin converting factor small subunit
MPRVSFTNNLQRHLDCPETAVAGGTVRAILNATFEENPKLRSYLLDDQGSLRQHVNIFVNNAAVRDRAGLTDPVGQTDEIFVMQALSGG